MARYIDADKLKDAFHTDTEHLQSRDEHLFDLIMIEIEDAPTADVAEVVRCKNCAYRCTKNCNAKHERADMDFCSSGIR